MTGDDIIQNLCYTSLRHFTHFFRKNNQNIFIIMNIPVLNSNLRSYSQQNPELTLSRNFNDSTKS